MKNKSSWLIIVLLLLVGITSVYVASTYAKYTATLPQESANAAIAKWAFDTDNSDIQFQFALDETYNESTLDNGLIAPGTEGTFTIVLSNANTETGVEYTMNLGVTPADMGDTFGFSVARGENSTGHSTVVNTANSPVVTGHLDPHDTVELVVDWYWEYESDGDAAAVLAQDTLDTAKGHLTDNTRKLAITADITGIQSEPTHNS